MYLCVTFKLIEWSKSRQKEKQGRGQMPFIALEGDIRWHFCVFCLKCHRTSSTVKEGAEQLNLCLQFCQPEVNRLVVENRLLEDLPLPRVVNGLLNYVVHRRQYYRGLDEKMLVICLPYPWFDWIGRDRLIKNLNCKVWIEQQKSNVLNVNFQ